MSAFLMPSLGADMEDGLLVEWEKQPGDAVARGDVIAVVETQKGAIEIEAFEDGTLESILVEPGTSVPVGTPLALIRGSADEAQSATEADVDASPEVHSNVPTSSTSVLPETRVVPHRQRATPAARRLAQTNAVELGVLKGSGPDGAIVLADVEAALTPESDLTIAQSSTPVAKTASTSTATSSPVSSTISAPTPPTGMRSAIAASMTRSKREIPHYYLAHSADLTLATEWLAQRNADRSPSERVLMSALFIAAVARAAQRHPRFNGHWMNGAFQPGEGVHVGMAIRLRGGGGGLVAPALHHADQDDPEALSVRLRDLVERVRIGRFRSGEFADPTLTLSSVGERGVETLFGVIYPPQVCLVGIGASRTLAWCEKAE